MCVRQAGWYSGHESFLKVSSSLNISTQGYNYENQILQLSTDSRQANAILQTDI